MIGIMFAIGALICYASLRGVSYEELVHDLQTLKWSWAMVAVLSMALSVVFEALVVKILVQQHLPHYPMRDAIRVPMIELLFNGITPFSTGGQPAQLFALQDGVRENAAQLRRSCTHLEHMVSDLLLLIKAQEPILPTSDNRINVMAQLEAVAASHKEEAARRGITIDVSGDESLEINGEAEQIQTALAKLVENAIIYSPDGASVNMTAKPDEDGERVVIRVLDRGIGIADKEQGRVFERFYRGGNQNGHSQDGIGLGLAIVKHIALTHHGSASVWSSPGQGSTFTLTLPLARAARNVRN